MPGELSGPGRKIQDKKKPGERRIKIKDEKKPGERRLNIRRN